VLLLLVATAPRAEAQFQGRFTVAKPAAGETYHVELRIGLWDPNPDITVSTDALGPMGMQILGDQISAVDDLGFTQKRMKDWQLVLRPARKHKFNIEYLPIKYDANTTLERDVVFNGATFHVGVPVTSSLSWNAWRFGYEYDFLYHDRWFVGGIIDVKYTDAKVSIASPLLNEVASEKLPIPAFGGVVRVYPQRNVSLTAQATYFKLPERISQDYRGRYVDYDLYLTANINNNFAAQAGYRSLDLDVRVKETTGAFALKGWYFGVVTRF
jgi:hypothetical protein